MYQNELFESIFGIMVNQWNSYEDRLVKNTQEDDFVVDTARVYDRDWEYEIGVIKEGYNDGEWIIVDSADTKEEAMKKHEKWVSRMREDIDTLFDIYEKVFYAR